jgi:hypothetical protein
MWLVTPAQYLHTAPQREHPMEGKLLGPPIFSFSTHQAGCHPDMGSITALSALFD